MDQSKVDLVIQYALAVAAEEDDMSDRELGPIHLIKYVYIADLVHAQENEGVSFTGTPWRFHNFGPFDAVVAARVEPAVLGIDARVRDIPSRYDRDFKRYRASPDSPSADDLRRRLPLCVAAHVKSAVHKYRADTEALLHYVYQTDPMLTASPGAPLVLRSRVRAENSSMPDIEPTSAKELKRRKARLDELRQRIQLRLAEPARTSRRMIEPPAPRYDDLFFESLSQVEANDGGPHGGEGKLEISSEFWRDPGRNSDVH